MFVPSAVVNPKPVVPIRGSEPISFRFNLYAVLNVVPRFGSVRNLGEWDAPDRRRLDMDGNVDVAVVIF